MAVCIAGSAQGREVTQHVRPTWRSRSMTWSALSRPSTSASVRPQGLERLLADVGGLLGVRGYLPSMPASFSVKRGNGSDLESFISAFGGLPSTIWPASLPSYRSSPSRPIDPHLQFRGRHHRLVGVLDVEFHHSKRGRDRLQSGRQVESGRRHQEQVFEAPVAQMRDRPPARG
jgi:hypothetical protein